MTDADLLEALNVLGDVLQDRGLTYDIVIIGGGALLLLGLIDRPTMDLDMVARVSGERWIRAEPLPLELVDAVNDVGSALDLAEDWLNAGPADLMTFGLPPGIELRTTVKRFGPLTVRIASRQDHVAFKLYASVDRGPQSRHFSDLRLLQPSREELLGAARWCQTHDPSEPFLDMLLQALAA